MSDPTKQQTAAAEALLRAAEEVIAHRNEMGAPMTVPAWMALHQAVREARAALAAASPAPRPVCPQCEQPGCIGWHDAASPAAAPFARGSWQHAVDDQLVGYGKTPEEFATPHDAVRWLVKEVGDAAVAAAAAPAQAAQPPGWQPIETAPKDRPVLLCADGEVPVVGHLLAGDDLWGVYVPGTPMLFQPHLKFKPTHWQDKPAAPGAAALPPAGEGHP